MPIPEIVRHKLGRIRQAFYFALGRQAMVEDVLPRDDDVWIVSYPKSGNTWTRFLIANLIAPEQAIDWTNIERIVPDIYITRDVKLRSYRSPRYLKSHEAYKPAYRKVIFIVRDPRDVAVSYFHFVRKAKMLGATDSIDEFMKIFMAGRIDPYGNWGENVASWLGARRGTPGFLVVRYEDLLANAEAELARIAELLELPADEALLRRAVENSRADRMRELEQAQRGENKMLKRSRADIPFVRSAKSGQWQTELPAEAIVQIETAWGDTMRELGYIESPVMEVSR